MFKLSTKSSVVVVILTVLILICLQSLEVKPTLSQTSDIQSLNQSKIVATATAPPRLASAILGGKPVHVLYVTQPEDTILVRCYPAYEPAITVRAMGSNPNAKTQKEGVMTCRPSR
jgi:hypothetical protein